MGRSGGSSLLKGCIAESVLLLLQDKALEDISVLEIVEKAGVNRSTYYRHFESKQDIIRYFYESRLDEAFGAMPEGVGLEDYFEILFTGFLRFREQLILLDRKGLSYLLLEELNRRIAMLYGSRDATFLLYCCYHVGGVFNSFRHWVRGSMQTPARVLARQCVAILPADFSPRLLK